MSGRALAANKAAKLRKMTGRNTHPAIEVAGALVFVYVNNDDELVISAHFDTADTETFPEWEDEVPVRVTGVDRRSVES